MFLLFACTATIQVSGAPSGAEVYITRGHPGSLAAPPVVSVAGGETPLLANVNYWAWDSFYAWVGADGYDAQVVRIPSEVKVGPLLLGIFCFLPSFLWVAGPSETPVYVKLRPESPAGQP